MRTKALILSAALCAASVVSTMAQTNVYSVNAVGYITVTVPANAFALISDPLNDQSGTNDLNTIIPGAPNNTTIAYEFDPVQALFLTYTKRAAGWAGSAGRTFGPGKGFFIQNNATTNISFTFVGEVPQGTVTNVIGTGFNLIAPQFPIGGLIETDLGIPAVNLDVLYKFDVPGQLYQIFTRRAVAWGGGNEPTIGVAEGFFYVPSGSGANWVRTFSANN